MSEQARFWFVHARVRGAGVALAVAAFTERQARVRARKLVGPHAEIKLVSAVEYAHAWVIDFKWSANSSE